MFNAINRFTFLAAATLMAVSCTTETERRAAAAEDLRAQAAELIRAGNHTQAIAILDSLDSAYHEQTGVRRSALASRAEAIAGLAMQNIGPADERLAKATLHADSLAAYFVNVEGPRGLEGYAVAKDLAKQNVTAATGVQPRVDNDGYISLAAVVKGKSIGLNAVSVTTQSGTAKSEIISSDRCISSEGSELTSFRQEEVAAVLSALEAAGDYPAKLFLDGSKGSVEVKLTANMRTALVRSWQYSQALQELRSAKIERERLERTLATARDHIANSVQP